jgi:hypothetical protein
MHTKDRSAQSTSFTKRTPLSKIAIYTFTFVIVLISYNACTCTNRSDPKREDVVTFKKEDNRKTTAIPDKKVDEWQPGETKQNDPYWDKIKDKKVAEKYGDLTRDKYSLDTSAYAPENGNANIPEQYDYDKIKNEDYVWEHKKDANKSSTEKKHLVKDDGSSNASKKISKKVNNGVKESTAESKPADGISFGKIAYNLPEKMQLEVDTTVVVAISKSSLNSILSEDIDTTEFKIKEIKVATRMKANLLDPTKINFVITPLSTDEQTLDDSSSTIWKFDVKPIRSGKNPLVLTATIRTTTSLGETYRDVPVFEQAILVESSPTVSLRLFVINNWQWLMTALVLPFGIWIYTHTAKGTADRKPITKRIGRFTKR